MKIGDLIRYWNIYDNPVDDNPVFGIIVQDLGFLKEYNEEVVKVHWLDDYNCTEEKTRELTDPECEYFEVVNENR